MSCSWECLGLRLPLGRRCEVVQLLEVVGGSFWKRAEPQVQGQGL